LSSNVVATKKKGIFAKFPALSWTTLGGIAIVVIKVFVTKEVTPADILTALIAPGAGAIVHSKASPAYKVTEAAKMAATETIAHVKPGDSLPLTGQPSTESQTIIDTVVSQVTTAFSAPSTGIRRPGRNRRR
jgi:hypothetical protein